MSGFAEYIKQETLSLRLVEGVPESAHRQSYKLDGHEVVLGIEKA